MDLHNNHLDPLWRDTPAARRHVYEFLADHLGIEVDECHVALFDERTVERAKAAFKGVTHVDIRAWCRVKHHGFGAGRCPACGKKDRGGLDIEAHLAEQAESGDPGHKAALGLQGIGLLGQKGELKHDNQLACL